MRRSRILVAGAVAAAAAVLLAPAAATAHTDDLYTWAYDPVGSDTGGFATTSKTDASLTLLPEDTLDIIGNVHGSEICNEEGYAAGWLHEDSGSTPVVLTWDHTTGAIKTGPTEISFPEGHLIEDMAELDTLADCSVITLTRITNADFDWAIAKVDPATGQATVLVELPVFETEWCTGLATAPDGQTYVFVTIDAYPNVALVDLAAGTVGTPVLLNGLTTYFDGSPGFTAGVDFDASGVLWAITGVDQLAQYHLVSFDSGVSLPSATPTDIGDYAFELPPFVNAPIPLTTEGLAFVSPEEPALAATGSEAPIGIAAGALALLVAGGVVLVLRPRAA